MQDFALQLPVWTIATTNVSPADGRGFSILRIEDRDIGPCMMLFTGIFMADLFVAQAKREQPADYQTMKIENLKSLCAVAECVQSKGGTHTVVDCLIEDSDKPSAFIPIQRIIDACRTAGA